MRIAVVVAVLSGLAGVASAQNSLPIRLAVPAGFARIHKLKLVSNDLPRAERQSIVHAFQGGTYNLDELAERIRQKLRDSGYELSEVRDPQIARLRRASPSCEADVRYSVHTGDQYRLGQITFTRGTVFTAAQLRAQFPLQDGDIFTASEIGKGLERLKDFYASAGYINFGAIPKPVYDNSLQTVRLVIDTDEGQCFKFGRLFFEGVEPRAGIVNLLLASWMDVKGKIYNPQLLKDWLRSTASDWPPGTLKAAQVQVHEDPERRLVYPVLYFQCGTYPVFCP